MNLFYWAILALFFAIGAAAVGFTGIAGVMTPSAKGTFGLFATIFVALVVLGVFGFRFTTL